MTEHRRRGSGPSEDLLGIGVSRFLAPAIYTVPGGAYARIVSDLGERDIPAVLPPGLFPSGGRRSEAGAAIVASDSLAIVDIESLGFIGRPLFLIGALYTRCKAGAANGSRTSAGRRSVRMEIVQYLARDYSEEEALVRAFMEEARDQRLWVTFNGRAFDLPFIGLRARLYRLQPPEPRWHLDLLPVARRLWGGDLPDCRLQTLEQRICGRGRAGDIPGSRIPEAYHGFVRSGEPWDMIEILRHNAADLVGLLDVYLRAHSTLVGGGTGLGPEKNR